MVAGCVTLKAPPNGNVDLTDGTVYESVAVFTCNAGYDLVSGGVTITAGFLESDCQADQQWSVAVPTCVIKGDVNVSSYQTLII